MLGYLLAVLVGTGSAGLYVAAFFFPEIHRKPDFIWGGVGLFYALVLWIYAREMSGGILVGQAASVALLGWFGWQTVKLRQLVPIDWQTSLPITKTPERSSSKSPNPTTPSNPTAKKPIEPKSPPAAPAAVKPATKPASNTESVRVEIGTTAPAKQPPTRILPDTSIEQDEEAWIRLEVKPSPDASTLIKEVTRSTPPPKPQPTQVAPPPAKPQPDRSIQTPPPPPPAKSQQLREQPPEVVLKTTIPVAPVKPAAEITPPPALLAAAKPLGEATQPPTTPPQQIEPVANSQPQQITPTEQTGDLDKLIAELESEI